MQEQILKLILEKVEVLSEKVEKIEVGQQKTNEEIVRMNGEIVKMNGSIQELSAKVTRLEEGQEAILLHIENSEETLKTCEQDHKFIEKFKKVAGE